MKRLRAAWKAKQTWVLDGIFSISTWAKVSFTRRLSRSTLPLV